MIRRSKALILMSVVVMLLGTAVAGAGQKVLVEGILARINDRIITISDFKKRLAQEAAQLPKRLTPKEFDTFAHNLFNSMVEQDILLERATEKKLTVSKKDIDRAIEALKKRNHLASDQAFREALKSAGLTEAMLRERYRQNMLSQRVLQSEIKPSQITTEELRQVYEKEKAKWRRPEKVHLEQLFFPVSDTAKGRQEVINRVRGLVSRVRNGADLKAEATLAGVAIQDLGDIPVGDLRAEVRDAIVGLKAGQITDPIPTAGGFQVIRLVTRTPAGYEPFSKVEEQIRREVSRKRYQEQTDGLINSLKKQYLVEIHKDLLDKILRGETDG
ncbi:MAG: hypothetical protein GXP48_01565 [Acidobacteria bacterium]|nr:hypothetical protein [Acidobacteriota bacterium]